MAYLKSRRAIYITTILAGISTHETVRFYLIPLDTNTEKAKNKSEVKEQRISSELLLCASSQNVLSTALGCYFNARCVFFFRKHYSMISAKGARNLQFR